MDTTPNAHARTPPRRAAPAPAASAGCWSRPACCCSSRSARSTPGASSAERSESAEPWQLSKVQAALPFEVTIGMIFIGSLHRRADPGQARPADRRPGRRRPLRASASCSPSFADGKDELWLLILGYGVISGFGLGVAYIVPIAMLQKWFPDKRGLITGLAVGGFGFGAVLTSPVAQWLIDQDPDEPDQGVPPARHRLPGDVARRAPRSSATRPQGYVVPGYEPATDAGGAGERRQGLHAGRGAAHPAVVPPHRDPHPQRRRRHLADLAGRRRAPPTSPATAWPVPPRPGRCARDLQRRRPDRVGGRLRLHRPDAHVRR